MSIKMSAKVDVLQKFEDIITKKDGELYTKRVVVYGQDNMRTVGQITVKQEIYNQITPGCQATFVFQEQSYEGKTYNKIIDFFVDKPKEKVS